MQLFFATYDLKVHMMKGELADSTSVAIVMVYIQNLPTTQNSGMSCANLSCLRNTTN